MYKQKIAFKSIILHVCILKFKFIYEFKDIFIKIIMCVKTLILKFKK